MQSYHWIFLLKHLEKAGIWGTMCMILEHFCQTNRGDWLTPSSNRNGTYDIGPKVALKVQGSYRKKGHKCPWSPFLLHDPSHSLHPGSHGAFPTIYIEREDWSPVCIWFCPKGRHRPKGDSLSMTALSGTALKDSGEAQPFQ